MPAIPTLHLNGTGINGFRDGLVKVHSTLRNAIEALCQAAPHGRDYYVQGPDAYNVARKEHDARVEKLTSVLREITEIWEGIQEQER